MSDSPEKGMSVAIRLVQDMQKDIEEFQRTGDRDSLVKAFKDEFMINRHNTASRTEETRAAATHKLLSRIDQMSDNMLLRVITELARIGEKDVEGVMGILPHQRGPMIAFNQVIGHQPQQSLPSPDNGPRTNPIQSTSQVLEAIEHLSSHFAAARQLQAPKRNPEDEIIDVEPE